MRANSDKGMGLPVFVRPNLFRRPVQHGIHELVAVGGAEALRERDRFVDGDAVGDVGLRGELEQADEEHSVLDRIEQLGLAVHPAGELGVEGLPGVPDAFDELPEILAVGFGHVLGVTELEDQVLPGAVIELPAVQGLKCEFSGDRAGAGEIVGGLGHEKRIPSITGLQVWRISRRGSRMRVAPRLARRRPRCPYSRASRSAISSAVSMDSPPLLASVVAARSSAWSTVSTVRTPKITGTPVSSATRFRPRAHSPATYSKCGVSPRMTHPKAITASQRPLAASLRATTGSSNAPGTRATRRSSAAPPCSAHEAVAPFSRLETMNSLKRAATMATLRPRAV